MENTTSNTLQQHYDKLFESGKLVCLGTGMWGMSYALTESDIKLEDKLPDVIKLGKKMLIKPEVCNKFKNHQQAARNYLYSHSHKLPTVPQSHFVPKGSFLAVYQELEKYKAEFYALVDEFMLKYEDYKNEAKAFYEANSATVDIEMLDALYPKPEEVRSKFYFDIISYEISMPKEFAAVDIHKEIDREHAADAAKVEEAAKYDRIYREQLNSHMAQLDTFVEDVVSELRTKVSTHCTMVINKINKKEVVSEASIKTLLTHIKSFRELNFVDDSKITSRLDEIEAMLTKEGGPATDTKEVAAQLRTHLEALVKEANDTTDISGVSGEYFRKLAV